MGRELSREFPRKRGERNRGYRRSMKRKIEPRVSREKRNFTIDRFERVALSLREVCGILVKFSDFDGIEIESKLDQIKFVYIGSGYKHIWQYILFFLDRPNQCNIYLGRSCPNHFDPVPKLDKVRFHATLLGFFSKFLHE